MPYTTAIVCLNGHILTRDTQRNRTHQTMSHCPQCCLDLISTCLNCNSPIRGNEVNERGQTILRNNPADAFCYNCGAPYPWTESALENAENIINELDSLSDEDKEKLSKSFKDLMQPTPKTPYAILLAKKALASCKGFMLETLVNLLVSSACVAVKNELGI